jgi:cellulose synthase/poly-beta-1,6-N-acetylglucosamine synthase-like glycosyltransferase
MATRMHQGEQVMQAHYGVRSADSSWRTRLMDVAFTLYHGVRSSARERLSLSTGLRGNGMGFTIKALQQVPYQAYSLVEDVEYGIELGLQGFRVAYVDDAAVYGEMVTGGEASESQRKRWEQGRQVLVSRYLSRLLSRGLRERNLMLLDLALDLLTPPLTTIVFYTTAGCCLSIGGVAVGLASPIVLFPWFAAGAGLAAYLAAGFWFAPNGLQAMKDLSHAPKYALWKLRLKLRGPSPKDLTWVRTKRNGEGP